MGKESKNSENVKEKKNAEVVVEDKKEEDIENVLQDPPLAKKERKRRKHKLNVSGCS